MHEARGAAARKRRRDRVLHGGFFVQQRALAVDDSQAELLKGNVDARVPVLHGAVPQLVRGHVQQILHAQSRSCVGAACIAVSKRSGQVQAPHDSAVLMNDPLRHIERKAPERLARSCFDTFHVQSKCTPQPR